MARDSGYAGRQKYVPPQECMLSCASGIGGTAVGLSVHQTGLVSSDWQSRGRYESVCEGIR
jgi:hypothetical protein